MSLEAAGNRLAELSPDRVAFIVFELAHKPADRPALRRGEDVKRQVRLRYAHCTGSLDVYLPRYKGADQSGAIVRAHHRGKLERGSEALPGAPSAGVFDVEARCFGYEDRKRVLAVATPS